MTFLTILEVTKISSFKLVLEGKTPESSRLEFKEKFSANNFALSDAEDSTSGPLNRGCIADLPLLRTLLTIRLKSQEPCFWEVIDSFVLLAYAGLAGSRTLLQWLLACLKFILESENLSFWYKWKKWFLWTMAAAQAAENHGDAWCLTCYFLSEIYTSIPTWTQSPNSVAAEAPILKDILPSNLSQMITKTIPISLRIVISYVMSIHCEFDGKSMETETTTL